jgi:hypothetical protein
MAATPWRARVSGDPFDLELLVTMFSSPGLRVVKDEDQEDAYFLESRTFEAQSDHMAVFEEAKRLLFLLNGAAKLGSPGYRDVSLSGQLVEPNAGGSPKHHHMVLADTVTLRTRVDAVISRPGEDLPAEPAPGSTSTDRWMRIADVDPDVAEALTIWGSVPHDWHNLYKVYEIINARSEIVGSRWATRNEVSTFTGSANHQGATGSGARHSRMKGDPPKRVITLPEADAFISHLLTSWFESFPDPGDPG